MVAAGDAEAEDVDHRFMNRAVFHAARGMGRTTPNPLVGAVVVTPGGVVVGQGAHLVAGGPHAEVVALEAAGDRARGATLYCTLEPCAHQGRTGPCVVRILDAGIRRVVGAVADPNPGVAGGGFGWLRARGVEVTTGVCEAAAGRQNAPFFTWVTAHRPFITIKSAVSSDGFVGRADRRVRLTGARADQFFHQQRAAVDAIAVGSGTVLVDDPLLTARGAYRARPLARVVFDWRGRVPVTARVCSTVGAGPVIMVTSASAAAAAPDRVADLERRGVVVRRERDRRLGPVLAWLASLDIAWLLVEGGPNLQAAFRDEGLIDRVQHVVTPDRLQDGVPAMTLVHPSLEGVRERPAMMLGRDALVEIDVHRSH